MGNIIGISEETTTGVARLYQLAAAGEFPFIGVNVNDSVTKSKFDNVYGCRHSAVDGILRATDVLLSGKKVVVCGYGDVGKGCAQAFKAQNSIVYVTEVDPICALQACMEGFRVVRLETVMHEVDVIISATGNKDIVRIEHMKNLKNNCIVADIGHFDNEIDMNGLKSFPGIKKINIMAQTSLYDDKIAGIKYEAGNIYVLPKHLDEEVARLHLPSLGAELTELKTDQAEYIDVSVRGPFKKDEYRY